MVRLDPLLALLLLLPAAWLAVPATLAGQLEPELSATGWWVLLSLAPAPLLWLRAPRPTQPAATLFAAFVALGLLSLQLSPPSDTLSASRAQQSAIAAIVAISAGAALRSDGRRALAAGAVMISIALTIPALAGVSERVQGALLNSGATSEAALLGALAAACMASARWPSRAFALLAVAAYGAFVALAPVLAGGLVFIAVLALLAWRWRANRRSLLVSAAVFVAAALLALGFARFTATALSPASGQAAASELSAGHLGGLGVRLAIAPRVVALFADHAVLGVGPGQFRAAFPPYRDGDERARSNQAAGAGVETEVEHAHNDYLTLLAEAGLLGWLAWAAALFLFARAAWQALPGRDPTQAVLAACVLGGLANALLRCPLSFNPASASLFFAAAGALLARDGEKPAARRPRRWLALLLLALLAVQVPRAWAFVRHGRALRAPDGIDTAMALAACPDSPLALSLAARRLGSDPQGGERSRELWERVITLRPYNFEARMQAGLLAVHAGDFESAREHWRVARRIAPERSGVHQNLLSLEAEFGDEASFEGVLSTSADRVPRTWLEQAGANAMLEGDVNAARRLWKAARVAWLDELPEQLYERARAAGEPRTPLVDAWEFFAHLLWAREHVERNDLGNAVRSYRQALLHAPQARTIRMELAAALLRDGREADARAELAKITPLARDWTRLPDWAGDALLAAGLLAR